MTTMSAYLVSNLLMNYLFPDAEARSSTSLHFCLVILGLRSALTSVTMGMGRSPSLDLGELQGTLGQH